MIKQGNQSHVELDSKRIIKYINTYDTYGDYVEPWREFKILEYISQLSPFFPQNVIEKGPYAVEYDYVEGKNMRVLNKKYYSQIYDLYKLLNIHGFNHGDPNYDNFIIDKNDNVHVIDFGLTYTTDERGPMIFGKMIYNEDEEEEEYIPPNQSYEYKTFPVTESFEESIDNLIDIAEAEDENWRKKYNIYRKEI